jgi:hypothetical protein
MDKNVLISEVSADYNPMLAIHGLNPRPALAYDLFLVSDTRVLSIFHLRLPAVLCVRFHEPDLR